MGGDIAIGEHGVLGLEHPAARGHEDRAEGMVAVGAGIDGHLDGAAEVSELGGGEGVVHALMIPGRMRGRCQCPRADPAARPIVPTWQ